MKNISSDIVENHKILITLTEEECREFQNVVENFQLHLNLETIFEACNGVTIPAMFSIIFINKRGREGSSRQNPPNNCKKAPDQQNGEEFDPQQLGVSFLTQQV